MARHGVGRLLRSTEGVGAESHRVAKVAQGGRFEESRRVAESQHIAQASRLGGGGEVLAGRHANACEYDAAPRRDDGGVASRRQTRCGSGAGRRGARRGGPEAHVAHLGHTRVVSLMRGAR